MSFRAMDWALRLELPHTMKAVLFPLAHHAGDDGACWPTVKTLAREAGLSKRATQKALRALEEAGYIDTRRRGRRSSVYVLRLAAKGAPHAPREPDTPHDVRPKATTGAPASPPEVHAMQQRGERGAPRITFESPNESSKPAPRSGGGHHGRTVCRPNRIGTPMRGGAGRAAGTPALIRRSAATARVEEIATPKEIHPAVVDEAAELNDAAEVERRVARIEAAPPDCCRPAQARVLRRQLERYAPWHLGAFAPRLSKVIAVYPSSPAHSPPAPGSTRLL